MEICQLSICYPLVTNTKLVNLHFLLAVSLFNLKTITITHNFQASSLLAIFGVVRTLTALLG
jgi:hypothetical protein